MGGKRLGWWIFESQMRREEDRWRLRDDLRAAGVRMHWVFLSRMLHRAKEDEPGALSLSTTERDFAERSCYDALYDCGFSAGSLHYLDPGSEVDTGGGSTPALTTYRGLRCVHFPQGYDGHVLTDPLEQMLVNAHGAFVHPGEYEELSRRKQQPNKGRGRPYAEILNQVPSGLHEPDEDELEEIGVDDEDEPARSGSFRVMRAPLPAAAAIEEENINEMLFTCERCKEATRDWSHITCYADRTCVCRKCLRTG
jgi:hypothetical protein